jgi:PKD repeat protein
MVTAPPAGSTGNTVDVFVTPVGGNAADGLTRSLSIGLTGISNATAPTPTFAVTPVAPVLRENVIFDASATMDEGVACHDACTYNWDFGDGTTATGRIVTRQFQVAQTYTLRLSVTDPAGTTAQSIRNISIGEGAAPIASFTFSPSAPALFEQVTFNAEGSRAGVPGRTISSQWDFGDGSTGSGTTTTHTYSSLGTFTVTLTVVDNAGVRSTSSQTVTVGSGVVAAFTVSPADPHLGESVFFDAEPSRGAAGFGGRSPIVLYIWNFGDSTTATETTSRIVQHTYTAAREYVVTLTVEDAAGRRATTTQNVTVEP